MIFSLGSVEESFQHPPCPHISGYTAPAVGQGTWGHFSLELTLQEGCLLLQRGARDKRSRSCHRLRRKSPRAGAPRQPGGRGLFLSGRFSQFSQVPDASDVTDIWIQFLQRKNLRHFNPFGGSKSGPKRKASIPAIASSFSLSRVYVLKSCLLGTEIRLKTHFTAIPKMLYTA